MGFFGAFFDSVFIIFLDVFHGIRNMFSYKKQKDCYTGLSKLEFVSFITRNRGGRLSRAGVIVSSIVVREQGAWLSFHHL